MNDNKDLYNDFNFHLLHDEKPSKYFNKLVQTEDRLKCYPFSMLYELIATPQTHMHHPEGSVWNHTMLVTDLAAEKKNNSEDARSFMWAALLHDIGKAPTSKIRKDRITSYDHDKVGEVMCKKFLYEFTDDKTFVEKVSSLVRWHMQTLFVLKDLPFADVDSMLKEVSLQEISLLSLCDRTGRGDMTTEKRKSEEKDISDFVKKCKNISSKN